MFCHNVIHSLIFFPSPGSGNNKMAAEGIVFWVSRKQILRPTGAERAAGWRTAGSVKQELWSNKIRLWLYHPNGLFNIQYFFFMSSSQSCLIVFLLFEFFPYCLFVNYCQFYKCCRVLLEIWYASIHVCIKESK